MKMRRGHLKSKKHCSRETCIPTPSAYFLPCLNISLHPIPCLLLPGLYHQHPQFCTFLFHLLLLSVLASPLHVLSRFPCDSYLAYILIFILQLCNLSDRGREGRKGMMTTRIFQSFFLTFLQRLRGSEALNKFA